jgi:hypothetical protein
MFSFDITDLDLEGEVLLQVLDDHDEEGELDAERLLGVGGARDVRGAHVGAHDLEHQRLDVVVGDALDVAVAHLFVPDLQRLRPDRVQDGEESTLESVLEHLGCLALFCFCREIWRPD